MTTTADLETLLATHEDDVLASDVLAELDDREEFPDGAVRLLDDAGLPAHYVLTPDGDFSRTVRLLRAVARRDLTVAIAHGKTFLGAAPVWVAGTPDQAARLAERVRAGEAVCWGLTERDHGADLLANEFTAVADTDVDAADDGTSTGTGNTNGHGDGSGGGWRLTGEKWLINNATRSTLACVLARTDPAGGGRGFSLFLVDKNQLPEASWRNLPKVRTHGIRGADISGFALDGAPVPADALVGEQGDGIAVVLKTLQLTRIACTALSLGATDHALRLARDFATGRELYGRRLADVPHVRRILGRAAAAALIVEAVSVLSARSVHTLPGELSTISALTKAYVPTLTQETLTSLGELLGVRGFLTSPPGGGFAKLERDHRICAIFDGSTVVNRAALLNQVPRLTRQLSRRRTDAEGLRAAADLTAPLPRFDRDRLTMLSVTGCSAVQALPDTAARIRDQGPPQAAPLIDRLLAQLARLERESADFVPVAGGLPSTAFGLAEAYERAYAAAACLLLWLENPPLRTGQLGADGLWLRACLTALLGEADTYGSDDTHDNDATTLFDALADVVLTTPATEFTLWGGAA
ncbi:acyl-CoA dehydrogenase family protein [Streptomyces ipomoeae]|uniref:Acyl-CoA dehydrogenase, C-terminal domain protein n=1 Tax=Streptomyces ipomoeae 91-03 TaxID=698759 RepID=L1L5W0_9ACTN|nr:acyl-CoA dehydrogenase [Streptomyces ipomoeae]EKX68090.1 acyl-CoA dehydrogenase, C-terminal domain protein [Streptomyces ipomoeae 91-03]MDX2698184.1 acyl-CoA dehydrogenase [Streptomyces ipomoeae]MDX2839904.1 acyl-CoA dehydrogenase [Streptomyces ipomoeae]